MTFPDLFHPDLIIEATNVCDRVCKGCYAPNVLITAKNASAKSAAVHLSAERLVEAWPAGIHMDVVSIRGGEPTLSPFISEVIRFCAANSTEVFLETNAEWIREGAPLLDVVKETGCTLKLSLDTMHGTSPAKAQAILDFLRAQGIRVAIAITEATEAGFETNRDRLAANFSGPVFWQKTAVSLSELVVPPYGVISSAGELRKTVTEKFSNKPVSSSAPLMLLVFALVTFLSPPTFAATPVTIGVAANFSAMSDSTSNPYANYFRNAIEMAFHESQEQLKAKGLEVKLKEFDYGDDKLRVIRTANEASESKALAVLGYIYSSDALLAGPIFAKNRLLLLTPTASSDRVEQIGRYVRRSCFNDSHQGQVLADYARRTQKLRRVAIIAVADCAYCQSLRAAFKDRFEKLGGKIVADQSLLSTDGDFKHVAETLKGTSYQAILLPNYEKASAMILSQLYDAGVRPSAWLGGDGWGNSVDLFYRIVGQRKFTAFTISHWHPDLTHAASIRFSREFTRLYRKPPVDTAVLAYDAAQILVRGLLTMKEPTREGLLAAVEAISHHHGVTGKIVYPPGSRTPIKDAVLLRLENGKLAVERLVR